MLVSLAAAAAVLMLAPPGASPQAPACSGTLSGTVTGKFVCTVDATVTQGKKVVAFTIAVRDVPPGVKVLTVASVEIPAPVQARSYTLKTLGQGGSMVVTDAGETYDASSTAGEAGALTLTFTRAVPDGQGRYYAVSGTLKARLVPLVPPARGEVIIDVKF